jgi:hypothetical protein
LFALWSHPAAHVLLPAAPSFLVPLEQAVELDDLQRECSEAYTMRQQLASAQQAEAQLRQQVAQLQRQAAAAGASDLSPRSSGSSDSVSPPRTAGRAAPTVLQGRLDAASRELSAAKQEVGGVGCACSLPICCIMSQVLHSWSRAPTATCTQRPAPATVPPLTSAAASALRVICTQAARLRQERDRLQEEAEGREAELMQLQGQLVMLQRQIPDDNCWLAPLPDPYAYA